MSVKTQELLRKLNECNLRALTIESNFPKSIQINIKILNLFTQSKIQSLARSMHDVNQTFISKSHNNESAGTTRQF